MKGIDTKTKTNKKPKPKTEISNLKETDTMQREDFTKNPIINILREIRYYFHETKIRCFFKKNSQRTRKKCWKLKIRKNMRREKNGGKSVTEKI